jgi:succinate dehydrogenase / fumarate reductase membrane anchor subunit
MEINMNFRSPISKVKGLGSAKSGTTHFIHQRITAIMLVPICIWFVVSIILILKNPEENIPHYVTSPLNLTLLVLFLISFIYHGMLGMQVIIEDYVHCQVLKVIYLIVLYFISVFSIIIGLISVITLHVIFRIYGG